MLPASYKSYWNAWTKAAEGIYQAQSKHRATPHMLRYTFATMRIGDVTPLELMQLLGHEDLDTTMGYIHRSKASTDSAYRKVSHINAFSLG